MATYSVNSILKPAILALALCCSCVCISQKGSSWATATVQAASAAPAARIVVVDLSTGQLLASHHLDLAVNTLAAPGSTLKPLILYGAIARGLWSPERRIACNRILQIQGHPLNCSHPPSDPMDARQALAWSCNTYFANLAAALPPAQLRLLLAPSGVLSLTGLAKTARNADGEEAVAEFREPRTVDETRLTLLGVEGIRVTPLELAAAYRWLALQFVAHPDSLATRTVRGGLEDSTDFGMAGLAGLGGVAVAGKTGTAFSQPGGPSHGWFVGFAPAESPRVVIAVYLPSAHGSDAARIAATLLAASPLRKR